MGCCEHDNEHSSPVKFVLILEQLRIIGFSRQTLFRGLLIYFSCRTKWIILTNYNQATYVSLLSLYIKISLNFQAMFSNTYSEIFLHETSQGKIQISLAKRIRYSEFPFLIMGRLFLTLQMFPQRIQLYKLRKKNFAPKSQKKNSAYDTKTKK